MSDPYLERWKTLAKLVERMAGLSTPSQSVSNGDAPFGSLPKEKKRTPPFASHAESSIEAVPVEPPPSRAPVESLPRATRVRTPVEKHPPISIFAIDYDLETAESFFGGLSWNRHGPDHPLLDPARKEVPGFGTVPVREYLQGMIPWKGRAVGESSAALADRTALLEAATISALQKARRSKHVRQQTVSEWFTVLPWSRS